MIDEATIRHQLAEFQDRLARIDEERQALSDILKGYQSLLKAMSAPDYRSPLAFTPAAPVGTKKESRPTGAVSMRSAVARALADAGGAPLHTKEILSAATALGASTTAKSPAGVVGLVLLNLAKKGRVERTAPGTWRWTETEPRPVSISDRPVD